MIIYKHIYENKLLIISYLTAFILIINTGLLKAQILDGGQNPPGIKWRQINTENFQILYPSPLEKEAQRMANTFDYMINKISRSLNKKPRSITIILQNQTVESNGFVQLAPRRSEFYATPGQEFDYQDWLNSLAIHELRHVVQFDKLTGGMKAPLFESLAFAIFGISLPAWFFEGDAVLTETILSKAGRGRQPSWEMPLRANLLNGRDFSYSKNYLGSYKDRTPGYYPLGYFMVGKIRRDHGPLILDTLMHDIARNPGRFFNLSYTSKKYTGLTTKQWHDATLAELKKLWTKQREQTPATLYPGINIRRDTIPEDYLLPKRINNQEIIALKRSKINTAALVKVDNEGKEKILLRIGVQQEAHLDYAAGKIIWDELREDLRYGKRNFNVICTYNLQTKKYQQITHRSRLFSPTLSPNGQKIAAIEVNFSNQMTLVELDAKTGAEIARYANLDSGILQTPQYHASGKRIVYLSVTQLGKAIEEVNLETKEVRIKLPYQPQLIARPTYAGDDILFKAHYNGIDNIYRLNIQGNITQLTEAAFGAFYPSFDEASQQLIFSNYQLNGYDIAELHKKDFAETPQAELKNHFIDYAKPLIAKEGDPIDFNKIPHRDFSSRPYGTFRHLFNFHSVVPNLGTNLFTDDWKIGLKAVSNNLLNTFDFYGGYAYDSGLRGSEYQIGFTYKALYPILNVNYIDKPRRAFVAYNNIAQEVNWREQETEFNVNVPFRYNKLSLHANLGLEFSTSYTSRYSIQSQPDQVPIIEYIAFPMRYGFYYSQNSRRSTRDLAPRWGHNYRIDYRHFPFDSQIEGDLLSIKSIFYTPGLFRNHSFSASLNWQQNTGSAFDKFAIDIPTVSGFNRLTNTDPLKNTILLDYRFPFAYPDWELGPFAYIKRFSAGFFADFENITANKNNLPRTYGVELSTDVNLLRFYLPNFRAGGKMIFSTEKPSQSPIFEFGLTYSY